MSDIHFPRTHFLGGMRRLNGSELVQQGRGHSLERGNRSIGFFKGRPMVPKG